MLAEAALVVAFVWIEGSAGNLPGTQTLGTVCGLLALLAGAMGLQTATLTRIGPLTIHTTFVTGMLNKFAQAVSSWLFWVHDEGRKQQSLMAILRRSVGHAAFRNARFMAAIWLCYMGGAIAGTWMNSLWQARALYLPGILVLAALIDQMWPLSLEEEQEQA